MAKTKEVIENQEHRIPEIYTNSGIVNFSPYEFEITVLCQQS